MPTMQSLPNQGVTLAVLGLITALAFMPLTPPATAQETRQVERIEELSPAERELLYALVREAILTRPEVVLEALERLRARSDDRTAPSASARTMTAPSTPVEHHQALFERDEDLRLGPSDAPIRIVKFNDYGCGFCRRAGVALEAILEANPDVQVIVKALPVLGPPSTAAARTMLAATREDPAKARTLHRMLLRTDRLDPASIERAVAEVGFDGDGFAGVRDGADVTRSLEVAAELASSLGISGTPWFVTSNEMLRGFPGESALIGLIARERERLKNAEDASSG
ncbi:MAG: hypothetical protein EA356_01355 [Geminicoccaceae bacterium]|nr:MAG: hypothetical protein EA356_01355 [Geminicoccaceae bacterium]